MGKNRKEIKEELDSTLFPRELITELIDVEKVKEESYFKGIVDYIKWTSTIGIGAILWIGNTLRMNYQLITIISLIFLISSLIIAIFIIYQVLGLWSKEWEAARKTKSAIYSHNFFAKYAGSGDPPENSRKKIDDKFAQAYDAFLATESYQKPKQFNKIVFFHIFLLVIGLILYIFVYL